MSNPKLKSIEKELLFKAILNLKSIEECYNFFEDLCTVTEIQSLAQRFLVASLLDKDKTYLEISSETGASTATISRINKCLEYGADGYRTALNRLNGKEGQ